MRVRVGIAAFALLAVSGCGSATTASPTATGAGRTGTTPPLLYRVPSGSMEPTLGIGDVAFFEAAPPKVGDIVVFHPPKDATQELCGPRAHVVKPGGAACSEAEPEQDGVRLIKRIVAGPGDAVSIAEGHVIRNGARERDPYVRQCASNPDCSFPTPIKVPADHWFLLGDNRGESDDSRFWGPIPTAWIVGVVRWCGVFGTPCAG
jgi:signal peptidase I